MRILIIGGSQFVGKHIALAALKHNHEVTLFNRGKTNPEGIPGTKTIIGDRDGGLDVVNSSDYDAVIDTCGYVPRVVKHSVEHFANHIDTYLFISTLSVYDKHQDKAVTEQSNLLPTDDVLTTEEIDANTYGPLKVLCEQEVTKAYPTNNIIVRPGYIVGPDDPTDRFTYWVKQINDGGKVIVPDNPVQPLQVIDVRDLGKWCVKLLEKKQYGVFNAVGPDEYFTFLNMLERIKEILKSDCQFIRISEPTLVEYEIDGQMIPMWISSEKAHAYPILNIKTAPLKKNGLTYTSFDTTVKDTLEYINSFPPDYEWKTGLTPEKKEKLLRLHQP